MPRIARKDLNTNYFHIITQGINKEYIFENKFFKEKYIELLLKFSDKYEIRILSYCIMDNHAHILLYCEKTNEMSEYMKSINTSYAKLYNHIKNRVGFVFRNRYETEPIYEIKHLLNCIGYIHNNPVKASITKKPEEYKYSSYCDYIKKKGIANDKTIELCFGNAENYLEQYLIIHKSKEKFKDYKNDIDYKEWIEKIKKLDIDSIKKDEKKLKRMITMAIKKEKVPINELAELLGMNRFKIYRLLKK